MYTNICHLENVGLDTSILYCGPSYLSYWLDSLSPLVAEY